jgi:hypothetical protein
VSGVVIAAVTVMVGIGAVAAKELPQNDCLIGVQDSDGQTIDATTVACTDGAACDADGATDGACTFEIRGCINIPGVEGCDLRPLKKIKFKVKGEKNLVEVTPADPSQATSVCGAFVDLTVGLKKNGKKAGKRKVIAKATADVKPTKQNKDSDKITFQCNPCPTESCVESTTTTTLAPVSTTSTTVDVPTTSTTDTTTTTEQSTTSLETTTTTEDSTTTTEESTTTLETTTTTEDSTTTTEESTTTLETTTTTEESTTTTTSPSSPSAAFLGDEPWMTSSS